MMEVDNRADMRPTCSTDDLGLPLPSSVILEILRFLDTRSLRCLKRCNRAWNSTVNVLHPIPPPLFQLLPNEIIQDVYKYLTPVDFNNARQSCHAWRSASLDTMLLGK